MTDGRGSSPSYGASHLHRLALYVSPPRLNVQQVLAWAEKTNYLKIALGDLPSQLAAAREVHAGLGESHPESDVRMYNAVPALRLGMALEFTSHVVYSLTEIAANVANKASAGSASALPASFNALQKLIDKGTAPSGLADALGDLSWYRKVREMRTEWAHYSAPFVAVGGASDQFRVYTERPRSEQKHLQEPALFTFDEYIQAVRGAAHTTEGLAHHVLVQHVLPTLDLTATRDYLTRSSDGIPIIRDGRMALEKRTVRDLLAICGVVFE